MPSTSPSSSPATRSPSLSAELHTFVAGRRLDDNAHMMLRFAVRRAAACSGAARWRRATRTACASASMARRAGSNGTRRTRTCLTFSPLGEPPRLDPPQRRRRRRRSRAPPRASRRGHPEGYLEGFAQLYTDIAEQIAARIEEPRAATRFAAPGADRRPRRARRALHRSGGALVAAQGRLGRSVEHCESPARSAGLWQPAALGHLEIDFRNHDV